MYRRRHRENDQYPLKHNHGIDINMALVRGSANYQRWQASAARNVARSPISSIVTHRPVAS